MVTTGIENVAPHRLIVGHMAHVHTRVRSVTTNVLATKTMPPSQTRWAAVPGFVNQKKNEETEKETRLI